MNIGGLLSQNFGMPNLGEVTGRNSGRAFDRLLVDSLRSEKKAQETAEGVTPIAESEAAASGSDFPSGTLSSPQGGGESSAGGGALSDLGGGGVAAAAADKAKQEEAAMLLSFMSSVYNWRQRIAEQFEEEEEKGESGAARVEALVGSKRAKSPEVTGIPAAPHNTESAEQALAADGGEEESEIGNKVDYNAESGKQIGSRKKLGKVKEDDDEDESEASSVNNTLFGNTVNAFDAMWERLEEKRVAESQGLDRRGKGANSALLDSLAGNFQTTTDWLRSNYGMGAGHESGVAKDRDTVIP